MPEVCSLLSPDVTLQCPFTLTLGFGDQKEEEILSLGLQTAWASIQL